MKKNNILDKPAQVFNLDETEMPLDPQPPKVVTLKGVKHVTSVSTGNKSQITVLSCCSASGNVIPPLVIFKQRVTSELSFGEATGSQRMGGLLVNYLTIGSNLTSCPMPHRPNPYFCLWMDTRRITAHR